VKRIKYVFDGEVYWYVLSIEDEKVFDFLINAGKNEEAIVKVFEENARKNYEEFKMFESNPEIYERRII
jgi:hypothetical protein